MSDKIPTSENVPLHWRGEPKRTSVRGPVGLKQTLDEFLETLLKMTGAKISRNEFILKSIGYYLNFCLEAKSKRELVERIKNTSEEI